SRFNGRALFAGFELLRFALWFCVEFSKQLGQFIPLWKLSKRFLGLCHHLPSQGTIGKPANASANTKRYEATKETQRLTAQQSFHESVGQSVEGSFGDARDSRGDPGGRTQCPKARTWLCVGGLFEEFTTFFAQ